MTVTHFLSIPTVHTKKVVMSFTYSYQVGGQNKTVSHEDLFAAFDLAFAHLNGDTCTPVSITGGDRTSVIDLCIILEAWRQQPELQMAALAERYAVQIEALETQHQEAMRKLSEAFRQDMLVLVAERDRRKEKIPIGIAWESPV